MIIIALITVIFLFGYGYVAEKSHRTKIIMEEWIGEHKEMLKTKDLSPRELIFIDSLKQLKFETVTFEKIEGYERYSLVLSYKRTRPL